MPRDLAHLSDEAVVALVARSDESAFVELFDRFGDAAYRLARRVLRDSELAEDVVQEAFLAMWRDAARYLPERSRAAAWIMMLVHRRAVGIVRKEQRRSTQPPGEDAEPRAAEPGDESAWLLLEEDRVRNALAELPDQQREAIELAYYAGFTQVELAERLGRPLGTIESQMAAGMHRLRTRLQSAEEGSWTTS